MSVTEKLFGPLLRQPATPLITYYDDATGARVELSRATAANWAAKTANWLRDECDLEPGDEVSVLLPAHWQTVGVLLGAWWCGAHVTAEASNAAVTFVGPNIEASGETIAVVALDALGLGLPTPPAAPKVDYLTDIRVHGDAFDPWQPLRGDAPALTDSTVDDIVTAAAARAAELGIPAGARVLSTMDWTVPGGIIDGFLSVLSVGGSLVQCANLDPSKLAAREASERITFILNQP